METQTDIAPEISSPPKGGQIHAAMAAIMAEVGSVAKGRKNTQQGYMFRGIADIYQACQPIMAKHGVHVSPHRVLVDDFRECTTAKGGVIYRVRQRIEFRFWHADGSYVPVETTGEAMDSGDKASNKCMSAAMKYALIQAFAIPEDDPEADTEHAELPEMASSKPPEPPKQTVDQKRAELWKEYCHGIGANIDQKARGKEFWKWARWAVGREVTDIGQLSETEVDSLLAKARAGEVPAKEAA